MSVYFSEKFKQLRKDKDLTQEQIANIFHVSPQAVSRWETGTNYPDVEMLPHLAIFFEITVDELLGTEEILSEKKVKEYIRDIRNLLNSGKLCDAIDLTHKAIKEYPLNNGLYYHLLQALCKSCSEQTPGYEENTKKYKDEIIIIGERLITSNPNNWGIKYQLVQQYAKWGMKEEAKKILDTMPGEIWDSQEPWAGLLLDGEEWLKNQKHRIIRTKYLLEYFIGGYLDKADLDILKKIECRKAKKQIEDLIDLIAYDNADDAVVHLELAFYNIGIAELYCEAGDSANALHHVENATQESLHHIEQMDKTNADGSNYMAWSTPRNLPWILWEDELMKPQFDIIRSDEKFIKCLEILKANSRELK